MNTREKIIVQGDHLVRTRGINAFSFSDISKELGIKNSSVHYYFPTKSALVLAILEKHEAILNKFISRVEDKNAQKKLDQFMAVYSRARVGGRISILGALFSDFLTFGEDVQTSLQKLTDDTLQWLIQTLEQGKMEGIFHHTNTHREKAIEIISQILGMEQLARVNVKIKCAE
jgi:TetR/AcrR family transcriptional repressor of nem operon